MSGRVSLLGGLLALQLVIIAVVLFTESGLADRDEGSFLAFEVSAVDEIEITGADEDEKRSVVLTRDEEGWRLPDGLPADSDKVNDVLETLSGLRAPWPVATSGSAAGRFEVTADGFQRHLVLRAEGEAVADLYLGTSPGYQQVHARRADDDAVYGIELSNYQVPAGTDEWLDKTLLQPRGEVAVVERADAWRLERGEQGWQVGGAAADQQAAADLVQGLSELRVTGAAEAPAADVEPDAVLRVTDGEGTYRLTFLADEDGNRYRVRSERRDGWFRLAGYAAERLLLEEQALLPGKQEAEGAEAPPAEDAPAEPPAAESSG